MMEKVERIIILSILATISLIAMASFANFDYAETIEINNTNATPTITATGRPSSINEKNMAYKWYTETYIDFCPHCKKYGELYVTFNQESYAEGRIRCSNCGADYSIPTGQDQAPRNIYLEKTGENNVK